MYEFARSHAGRVVRRCERAAVDDRDLRQVVLHPARALVAALAVPGQRRAADGDELGELDPREAQVGQDRVQLRHEHVRGLEHGLGALQEARGGRHAGLRRPHERVDVVEEVLEVGRERAEVAQRRGEVARRLSQVAHQRVGVLGERLEPPHRRARLAQEGREDLEGLGERVVARRERPERRVAVRDQPAAAGRPRARPRGTRGPCRGTPAGAPPPARPAAAAGRRRP